MQNLTGHALAVRDDLSRRYNVSAQAVETLMDAVSRGGGGMAQFSHPELGGMGQWSSGGMTMVGDMFNTHLQGLVAGLCSEIAQAWRQGSFYEPVPQEPFQGQYQSQGQGFAQGGASFRMAGGSFGSWWPAELGQPSSSGSQNNLSYAIFPDSRRLAVNLNGQVTVYDTLDHLIGGVGQQQSGDASWTFTSQYGTVYLNQLPVISGQGQGAASAQPSWSSAPEPALQPVPQPAAPPSTSSADVFAALEKLGSLRDMGVLTEDEFQSKKAELLSRL